MRHIYHKDATMRKHNIVLLTLLWLVYGAACNPVNLDFLLVNGMSETIMVSYADNLTNDGKAVDSVAAKMLKKQDVMVLDEISKMVAVKYDDKALYYSIPLDKYAVIQGRQVEYVSKDDKGTIRRVYVIINQKLYMVPAKYHDHVLAGSLADYEEILRLQPFGLPLEGSARDQVQ